MGRTALDMQHDGARKLRELLASEEFIPSSDAGLSYVSDVTTCTDVHRGDSFIITLAGYDYEVTVKFEDPR